MHLWRKQVKVPTAIITTTRTIALSPLFIIILILSQSTFDIVCVCHEHKRQDYKREMCEDISQRHRNRQMRLSHMRDNENKSGQYLKIEAVYIRVRIYAFKQKHTATTRTKSIANESGWKTISNFVHSTNVILLWPLSVLSPNCRRLAFVRINQGFTKCFKSIQYEIRYSRDLFDIWMESHRVRIAGKKTTDQTMTALLLAPDEKG